MMTQALKRLKMHWKSFWEYDYGNLKWLETVCYKATPFCIVMWVGCPLLILANMCVYVRRSGQAGRQQQVACFFFQTGFLFQAAQQDALVTWAFPRVQSSTPPPVWRPPSKGAKPPISPFHTPWTWNNQSLIAAVHPSAKKRVRQKETEQKTHTKCPLSLFFLFVSLSPTRLLSFILWCVLSAQIRKTRERTRRILGFCYILCLLWLGQFFICSSWCIFLLFLSPAPV